MLALARTVTVGIVGCKHLLGSQSETSQVFRHAHEHRRQELWTRPL